MKQLQPNSNCFEKAKVRGLFSFLVKYPQTFIRATSVAFVANGTAIYLVAITNHKII